MKKSRIKSACLAALLAIAIGPAGAALAQSTDSADAKAPATTGALAEGEVRKVDLDAKKITIRHGPIANLDMPAMTMVFQVKDPGMLDQVKAGDKIRFSADKVGSVYTVTRIEPAK